ncbi:MAG: hypothetical protein JSU73_10130 [candidate division WOR-3 bacterium]|nr:MAG: hypothetical protein JSU73_10130 [candidate division WOR-3 bacterium]
MTSRIPPARVLLLAAAAAAHGSLSITPQLVELELPRGARKTLYFSVINEDNENERTVRYYALPYRQKSNGAYEVTAEPDHDFSGHSWFDRDTTELKLGPGKGTEVQVRFRVPTDVTGTNYGAVAFEMTPVPAKDIWSVGLTIRVPAFVEVTVLGSGRPAVELAGIRFMSGKELRTRFETDVESGILSTAIAVRNPGPVSAPVRGRILIRDSEGRRYREFPLGGGGSILPGADVEVLSVVPMPRSGDYSLEVTLDYGGARPVKAAMPFRVAGGQVQVEGEMTDIPQLPLELSKGMIQLDVPRRATRFDYLVLRNVSTDEVRLSAAVTGLAGDGRGGLVSSDSSTGLGDCRSWIQLDSGIVSIPPNGSKALRVMFKVPEEAVGGNYACIVYTPLDAEQHPGMDPLVIPVLLSVTGKSERTAEIVESRVNIRPVGVNLRIQNTGNVHFTPQGSGRLRRVKVSEPVSVHDYETVGEIRLADPGIVLPGGTIDVSGSFVGQLQPGQYRVDVALDCGGGCTVEMTETVRIE